MELVKANNTQVISINEINEMQQSAMALLKTGHYRKLGQAGIFAVLQMARSIGTDPIQALNGGLYPVDGKVEMDGRLMMSLIRQAGHSITKDKRSTATHCILHGKRADTGDTWTESFGMEDAKKAGLLSRGVYAKYGKDMFQWRALSRLARFLFPDVIKGCYAIGEIKDGPKLDEPVDEALEEQYAEMIEAEVYGESVQSEVDNSVISNEQFLELDELIGDDTAYRNQLLGYLMKHHNVNSLQQLPIELYERVKARAVKCWEARNQIAKEA